MRCLKSFLVLTLLACATCQETTTSWTTLPTDITITTDTTKVSPTATTASTSTKTVAPTSSPSPKTTDHPTSTIVPSTSTLPSTTNIPITTAEPPVPGVTFWNVTDENNVTCIRAELKIRFKIPEQDKFDYIVLTQEANNAKSSCNSTNGTQVLSLEETNYELTMEFSQDTSSSKVYVKKVEFSYMLSQAIHGDVSNDSRLFEVNSGNSYLCNAGDVEFDNVTMEIMHIKIQAFQGKDSEDFGTVEECEADNKVNDLVPIVVGCALLALVVIVLIAYFVGRRRSRQRGYQSV